MKAYRLILLFVIFLVNPLFSNEKINLSPEEQAWINNNPVVTYSEVNWKPLSIIEDNTMKGIMGDYLKMITTKTGLEFKFLPATSWRDVLEQFSQKKIDLVPGISSSPQEVKLGLVSKKYATYPMVIVTKDKYKYLDDLKNLDRKVVAIPKYYTSYNEVKNNYPEIKILATKSITEALLLVEKGEAEAFVGHIAPALYYIAENYLSNLKVTGATSFRFEHHCLVQRDNPILLSIINKVFDSISHEERSAIYSKWIQPSIVEEKINYTVIFFLALFFLLIIAFLVYRHRLIKRSHQDLTNILNTTLDGIMISHNRVCIKANKPILKMLNYTEKEFIGKNILEIIVPEYHEKVEEALLQDECEPYEAKVFNSEGKTIPMLIKGTNIIVSGQKVRISSFVDLTETKQRETLLHQQTKMAAMGEMMNNIAHQWRQPIAAISMSANNIFADIELGVLDEKNIKKMLDNIFGQTQYLSKTIDDFRNFFNPEKKEVELVSIGEIMDSTLKIVEAQFNSKDIDIIKNREDFELLIVKNELTQVLVNILNNAKDAFEKVEGERLIFVDIRKSETTACIEIYDNAQGIDKEIMHRIFEPYFTTKHQSRGTGIGLYMAEEIISKHFKGEISVYNKVYEYNNNSYKGACFKITIPIKK